MSNDRLIVYLMNDETPPKGYVEVCRTRGWETREGDRCIIAWADPVHVDLKDKGVLAAIEATASRKDVDAYKAHIEGRRIGFSDGRIEKQ